MFAEGDTRGIGPRLRIGCWREFANLAEIVAPRLRPEFDLDVLTNPVALQRLLRQIDGHFPLAIRRQYERGLPRSDHLPDLDSTLRDQAIAGGAQYRVIDLVAGHIELGACLLQTSSRGAIGVVGIIELRLADQLATEQRLVAVMFGLGQAQIGFRRRHLRTHAVQLQPHVLRIETCQGLVLAYAVARFDQALDDLATDAEGQLRLVARVHFAGIALACLAGRLRLHHHDRARQLLGRLAVATGDQNKCTTEHRGKGQGMSEHDEVSLSRSGLEYLYCRV